MKREYISDAVGSISAEHIQEAERYSIAAGSEGAKRTRRPVRRAPSVALAAALALICTMAVALAASPELREAIISLFRIEEVEPPAPPGETELVSSITIGDEVLAQYVYNCNGMWPEGELLVGRSGEGSMAESNARVFYTLDEDNNLTQIGQDATEEYVETQWDGLPAAAHFSWFVYHDRLYLNDILNTVEDPPYGASRLFVTGIPGRTDKVILDNNDSMAYYFWIYDLNSGELTDVLAGCGFEEIGRIRNRPLEELASVSSGLRYALLELSPEDSEFAVPYLADFQEKTCTPLSELMGLEIPAQEYLEIQTGTSHLVRFLDAEHIQLTVFEDPQGADQGRISCWVYHIPSGTVTQTVAKERLVGGASPLWLTENESGTVWVIDARTGERTQIEEFPLTDGFQYGCNEAGTRLLCIGAGEADAAQVGVIDLVNGTFRILQRGGPEDQYNNSFPEWLGDDRAVSGYVKLDGEFYLCVYTF